MTRRFDPRKLKPRSRKAADVRRVFARVDALLKAANLSPWAYHNWVMYQGIKESAAETTRWEGCGPEDIPERWTVEDEAREQIEAEGDCAHDFLSYTFEDAVDLGRALDPGFNDNLIRKG